MRSQIGTGIMIHDIHTATPEDITNLFELNTLFGNSASIDAMSKSLLENADEIVCIAYEGDVAVGFCTGFVVRSVCYAEPRVDIETLFVREEFRRRGIGEALLSCFEAACAARGIRHFHLTTGADNLRAQALYAKHGYESSGEILMEKTI